MSTNNAGGVIEIRWEEWTKTKKLIAIIVAIGIVGVLFKYARGLLILILLVGLLGSWMKWKRGRSGKEGMGVGGQVLEGKREVVPLKELLTTDFHPTTSKNPFGNVLLTDINDHPLREAAAPSFSPEVYENIRQSTKKQTQELYPGIINTNRQLYGDLKESYDLDRQFLRTFYSTANTRVSDDQGALGEWLYAGYPSGKEAGLAGAIARVRDNYRWILR